MSITFAVPDLHGRFDLFIRVIDTLSKYNGSKVVWLGDYIDRGPQSCHIIESLMAGTFARQSWICLKGNHEDMMVRSVVTSESSNGCIDQNRNMLEWTDNGGTETLNSYKRPDLNAALTIDKLNEHCKWLARLPLFHVDQHRVYVHADVDPSRLLDNQNEDYMISARHERDYDVGYGSHHVVHGHTPYEDGPVLGKNRTNLDTLAFDTNRLCIGVFDDDIAGGPTGYIEVNSFTPTPIFYNTPH